MEEATPDPPKKSSTGKIIAFAGCGCLGLILLGLAGIAALVFGVFGALKSSDTYSDTLALIRSNPEAVAALGEPIEPGFWLTGSINFDNGVGSADLTVPVSGPKGSGSFHVVADKPNSNAGWNYTTRELTLDGEEGKVIQIGQ